MERKIYVEKQEVLINEGIKNGKYAKAEDTTLQVLKSFQTFLTRTNLLFCMALRRRSSLNVMRKLLTTIYNSDQS